VSGAAFAECVGPVTSDRFERTLPVPYQANQIRRVSASQADAPGRPGARREPPTGRNWKKTGLIVGGSTAAGAGIGALVGGKTGALIGAAIGGGASSLYEATH
jgi:hypothetical protein